MACMFGTSSESNIKFTAPVVRFANRNKGSILLLHADIKSRGALTLESRLPQTNNTSMVQFNVNDQTTYGKLQALRDTGCTQCNTMNRVPQSTAATMRSLPSHSQACLHSHKTSTKMTRSQHKIHA